ncbi:MAG: penicillin-binding protein 2 [Elainellaceae cyanobacterium]
MHNAVDRENLILRGTFVVLLMTTLMGVCGLRIAQIQLAHGHYYRQLADQNRIRLVPIPSDRGNITDRNGKILAANRLTRSVYLWPRYQSRQQWRKTATDLGALLNIPSEEIIQRLEKVGYNSALPIRVSQRVDPKAFVTLAEQALRFPGVQVLGESSRYYPHGDLAAHVVGYIGEANEEDMNANPDYPMGMIVGQMGVERLANERIEGAWGSRLVEVDVRGRELRWLGVQPPEAGSQVRLTLDLDLQKAAEKALNQRRGAVAVLNVQTGEVLALASGPSFDPNMFTRRVTEDEWNQLQGESQPFLNRALQGYAPGSTFKIVTATAGMQSGKFSPNSTLGTSAFITVGGTQFWEHSNRGYGVIGFPQAIAYSSNTFFYQVGIAAGPQQISHWAKVLGVGVAGNLGLGGGNGGMVPTPDEKEELFSEPWYTGDTVSMAIGQGLVQVTPLELATVVSTIVNGGWRVQPHLLADETNTAATEHVATGIPPESLAVIRAGMVAAVQNGTARRLNDGSIPLTGGKTGTAEVVGKPSHSLFIGFGPADNPQIAIAAIVENGGYGSTAALPIAHEIYKVYFNKQPHNGN